ncbi:hypothetical protein FIBSPDRAFT_1042831 [Athelia psychrophila]|uniref:Uncharacterized protein n=1 Tax=Athelia psychrophila TaxID=1759441 RepID=A0A166M666_9AGAM|nr:hypothetical protein FIBSPDRAFT_1042831 [Fibularhizoctonia sp. CBS 109695]
MKRKAPPQSASPSKSKRAKDAQTPKPTAVAKAAAPTVSTAPQPSAKFSAEPLPPQLTGKFDIYSTGLSFLSSAYLPKGSKSPNFQAVYEKILFYQAKPDFTMRCALREEWQAQSTGGRLHCSTITNPIDDEPLDPLCIVGGKTKNSVNFDATECPHPSTVGNGWGYEARMEVGDGDEHGCKDGAVDLELFEGYWFLKVAYGPTLRRKRFGTGESYNGSFWAVRALKKDGVEVGIDAGDGMYTSTSSYDVALGDDDDDDDEFAGEGYGDSEGEEDSDDYESY